MAGRAAFLAAPVIGATAAITAGAVAGVAAALFGAVVSDRPLQLAVLPLAIVLCIALLADRAKLLLVILAFRSAGDVLLDATRFSLGGYQIGAGGLINAFVILLVLLLAVERPKAVPGVAVVPWAAFLLATLASVALAPDKADAIRLYLALLSYFAVFVAAFHVVRSVADFRFCVRVVLWSSAIPVAYALVELATGGGHRIDGVRLQSTFAHPNIFAFYLTLVVALVLYTLHTHAPPWRRAGLNLYMLLLLALLALTQTRSAWIACALVFAMYGLCFKRRYLAYLLAAPLVALLIPGVQDRLLDLGAGNEYGLYARLNSFAWRRLMWETALRWMQPERYFLGYGLGSFTHYSPQFFPLAGTSNPGAHNVYVQLMLEAGLAGLLAWLWLYGRLLRMLRGMAAVDRPAAFIAITLVAVYLVIAFSDNMLAYLSFNWYFWFVAGAACSVAVSVAGRQAAP